MAQPAKILSALALVGKEEATYGTPIALTPATDGIQMQYDNKDIGAPVEIDYAFDGDLGPTVSTYGPVLRAGKSGRSAKASLPFRFRGAGIAYSASVFPNMHRILKASGFDATGSFGAGTESWTYALTTPSTVPTSLTLNVYTRLELWAIAGAMGDINLDAPGAAPPIWTWDMMGIANALPTDTAVPGTLAYPNQTVQPAVATSIAFVLGNLSANAIVRKSGFKLQRKLAPRVAQSGSGGHLGFVADDVAPIITVTLEATALTTTPFTSSTLFDPYNLAESGISLACSLQYGTVQYNKQHINLPQAQVIDAKPSNDGPVATVDLTIQGYNSTATTLDCVNIVAD